MARGPYAGWAVKIDFHEGASRTVVGCPTAAMAAEAIGMLLVIASRAMLRAITQSV